MTIDDYMNNPYGKSDKYPSIEAHKRALEGDYNKIKNRITMKVYQVKDSIVCHFQIPSHSTNQVMYDIVIEFEDLMDLPGLMINKNIEWRAFSNCPSFMYTYANLFKDQHMLCDWLFKKYSKQIQEKPPEKRNPYVRIQFERSLYIAFYHMRVLGLYRKDLLQMRITKSSYRNIADQVASQEEVESKYRQSVKASKELEKQRQSVVKVPVNQKNRTPRSNVHGKTSKVAKSGKVSTTKKTKHI